MVTGKLLVWLGLLVYGIFTLWPDSSVLQVSFPWVLIWQAGMLCLVIAAVLNAWRVGQPFYRLGGLADVSALLTLVAAALATGFSPFPHHSLGYAIHLWGWVIVLYLARNAMGADPRAMSRLHSLLAWLTVLSGLLSVLLYGGAILLPTLSAQNQVNAFLAEGDRLSLRWLFDFNEIQNRNGVPLGHQNYVAGYLLLGLPLLTARALIDRGWQQTVWLAGIGLGAVVLFTTSSRGGDWPLPPWYS
ncbi:MAG: hypothetical protein HC919_01540 [Oscillatoriales cyanobacterium SM2_2_1]|nr:hypothetical protein [Oscillatoriales cyanobacterium SM2_2_1]